MPIEYGGDPAAQFQRLARDLKRLDPELKRQLNRELRVVTKPLINDAKDNAAATLPKGGGTTNASAGRKRIGGKRARVADSPVDRVVGASYSTRIKTTGKNVGVMLRGIDRQGRSIDLRALDRGILRHPLFGNRNHWYATKVPAGWWTKPMEKGKVAAEAGVIRAVNSTIDLF